MGRGYPVFSAPTPAVPTPRWGTIPRGGDRKGTWVAAWHCDPRHGGPWHGEGDRTSGDPDMERIINRASKIQTVGKG